MRSDVLLSRQPDALRKNKTAGETPEASGNSAIAEQRGRILWIQRYRDVVVIEDRGLKHIREAAKA
ncbi:hypothetical protein KRX51_07355 [Corynebacterium sp. TAE3-ERU12]|uniref:hypothetical protein n=1 Tax=Corynebacterium sp. TAE3-ERU12 TaxID=2849491 RepID=UPI001C4503BC|nr:hypothetical protein [Corynebacterium sp. TAE3-ERU12]MBV7295729.1 hypothetical protein [Corynebacterium sp. TAE3-ERU12]